MPANEEEFCNSSTLLVEMIASLSNSQRLLTLSALDYQALGLAKRHEREKAIDLANELGKVIEPLIKSLRKKVCCFIELNDPPHKFIPSRREDES